VSGGKDVEGQSVLVWKRHNGANQRWKIIYTDQVRTQTKGMNKDFGFEVNRPFYIVSRLPMNRVLEQVGTNGYVRIRQYVAGKTQQQWIFDETKTIKSV